MQVHGVIEEALEELVEPPIHEEEAAREAAIPAQPAVVTSEVEVKVAAFEEEAPPMLLPPAEGEREGERERPTREEQKPARLVRRPSHISSFLSIGVRAPHFRRGATNDVEFKNCYDGRTTAEQRLFDQALVKIDKGRYKAAKKFFRQKWKKEEQSLEELREHIWPTEADDAELRAQHQQWQQLPDKIEDEIEAKTTLNDYLITLKTANVKKLKRHIGYSGEGNLSSCRHRADFRVKRWIAVYVLYLWASPTPLTPAGVHGPHNDISAAPKGSS
ncbi:unnamed protein product [Vitrella brassicaformis CCMP3155]|uniref:Uncharacterized protein n=1 Tax=Vitrella brassicaformis (strain CCMP3155) TaxID=1169540 RepID=A0A0G4FUT6_VITBC|nr:unnamed protein product [Vitrella brassicaformis CCMP3155]|eukprot:CEM18711.1 unnamed protein product [Vitrella brassicaformis CCMP3155]